MIGQPTQETADADPSTGRDIERNARRGSENSKRDGRPRVAGIEIVADGVDPPHENNRPGRAGHADLSENVGEDASLVRHPDQIVEAQDNHIDAEMLSLRHGDSLLEGLSAAVGCRPVLRGRGRDEYQSPRACAPPP